MGYEDVMLAIKARKAEQTKTDIDRRKYVQESAAAKAETQSIYDKIYREDIDNTRYNDFRKQITDSFVTEALTILVDNCLEHHLVIQENHQKLVRQLVTNFVLEEGSSNLLRKMRSTSLLMSELAYDCDKAITATMEAVNKDDGELKLDPKVKGDFYDNLKKADVDATVREITDRVRNETSKFNTKMISDKSKMIEALDKTNAKVEEAKQKLENTPDASEKTKEESKKLQEAYINAGKREIMDIRESGNKTVFECMVFNLSKSAFVNEAAGKAFISDSKLDMDKIVEHCEVLYTFLTCMDSCKLINVDEAYIQDMLNNLKG